MKRITVLRTVVQWWVLALSFVAMPSLSYAGPDDGYWTSVYVRSYYVLSSDMQKRTPTGETTSGSNLYKEGLASRSYPIGTRIYLEELSKWYMVDDKIPNMDKETVYVRVISSKATSIISVSRIYVIYPQFRRRNREQ